MQARWIKKTDFFTAEARRRGDAEDRSKNKFHIEPGCSRTWFQDQAKGPSAWFACTIYQDYLGTFCD